MDTPTPLRLRAGCHLFAGRDGTWRIYGPEDRFAHVSGPPETLAAVARLLGAEPDSDSDSDADPGADAGPAARPDPASEAGQLVAALAGRGLLEPVDGDGTPRPDGRPRPTRVRVVGTGPVADALRRLLAPEVRLTGPAHDGTPPPAPGDADVAVWCAGPLPDAAWKRFDAACAAAGVPWHMCHLERGRFFVGPFSVPGRTASYRDTRGRRLAAAASPDDLRQLWRHLDGLAGRPVRWPPPAAAALAAAALAHDMLTFLDRGTVPSDGDQLEIDPATLTVEHHPVLPLPELAGG